MIARFAIPALACAVAFGAEPGCQPGPGAEPCFKVHARIVVSNGVGPNLWPVGSKRRFAMEVDEKAFPTVDKYLDFHHFMCGDFIICPAAFDRPGLKAVSNLVVEPRGEDGKPGKVFRPRCPECKASLDGEK